MTEVWLDASYSCWQIPWPRSTQECVREGHAWCAYSLCTQMVTQTMCSWKHKCSPETGRWYMPGFASLLNLKQQSLDSPPQPLRHLHRHLLPVYTPVSSTRKSHSTMPLSSILKLNSSRPTHTTRKAGNLQPRLLCYRAPGQPRPRKVTVVLSCPYPEFLHFIYLAL